MYISIQLHKIAKDDLGYYFSWKRFYETGIDEFGFLKIFLIYLTAIDAKGSGRQEPRRKYLLFFERLHDKETHEGAGIE